MIMQGRSEARVSIKAWAFCLALCLAFTVSLSAATNLALKLDFNPTHFVEVPNKDTWDFATNLTVEAWVLFSENLIPASGSQLDWMAVAMRGPDGGTGFRLGQQGKFFIFELRDANGHAHAAMVHAAIGIWAHLAGTWDGETIRLEAAEQSNGQLMVVEPPVLAKSPFPLLIGKEGLPNAENIWSGRIDEVRLWNRALTPAEIRARKYQRLHGNELGLVGYWNFDQGDGRDRSVNAHHGVVRGAAQFIAVPAVVAPVLKPSRVSSASSFAYPTLVGLAPDFSFAFEYSADLKSWSTRFTDFHFDTNQFGEPVFIDKSTNQGAFRFYRIRVNAPPP